MDGALPGEQEISLDLFLDVIKIDPAEVPISDLRHLPGDHIHGFLEEIGSGGGVSFGVDPTTYFQDLRQSRKSLTLPRNHMKTKTRGEAEAEITQAVVKFEKEYLGHGPLDARTFFVNDMVLIRLRGVLTAGDRKMAETREGQALLKETRRHLFESSIPIFEEMIVQVIGCKLISLHTDLSSKTGERIIVITTDKNLESLYR